MADGVSSLHTGITKSQTDRKRGPALLPRSCQGSSSADLPPASAAPTPRTAAKIITATVSTTTGNMLAPSLLNDDTQEGSGLRPHLTTVNKLALKDLVVSNVKGIASPSSSVTLNDTLTTATKQVTASDSGGAAAAGGKVVRSRSALRRRISDFNSDGTREILSRKAKRSRSSSTPQAERGSKRRVIPAGPHGGAFRGKEILSGLGMDSEIEARRLLEKFLQDDGEGTDQSISEAMTGCSNTTVKTNNEEGRLGGKDNAHAIGTTNLNIEKEATTHGGTTKNVTGATPGTRAGRNYTFGGFGAGQTLTTSSDPGNYEDNLTSREFSITNKPPKMTGSAAGMVEGNIGAIMFTVEPKSGVSNELVDLSQAGKELGGCTVAAEGWGMRAPGEATGEDRVTGSDGSHGVSEDKTVDEGGFLFDEAVSNLEAPRIKLWGISEYMANGGT